MSLFLPISQKGKKYDCESLNGFQKKIGAFQNLNSSSLFYSLSKLNLEAFAAHSSQFILFDFNFLAFLNELMVIVLQITLPSCFFFVVVFFFKTNKHDKRNELRMVSVAKGSK
jgi:hypothetical protein